MIKNPIRMHFFCIIIIFALLLAISILYQNLSNLKQEVTQLTSNIEKLDSNFKFLQGNYESLKKENDETIQESEALGAKMKSVEIKVDKATDKLTEFQTTVKDSIQWFRDNINIETYSNYDSIKKDLQPCIHQNNTCRIDLKCIDTVNVKNGFKYKLDEQTTKKSDFLQDLSNILKNKGGDCEDFSLLYRAEYNYLVDECLKNYTRNEILPYTRERDINKTHMYIVCGTWDPNKVVTNWAGHCMVALSENLINSSRDIYQNIKRSTLIEPQNGELEGDVDESDTIRIFPDAQPPNTLHYLDFVIIDNDLIIFNPYTDEVKWTGYNDFLKNSEDIMELTKK